MRVSEGISSAVLPCNTSNSSLTIGKKSKFEKANWLSAPLQHLC